jgi:hypothetical protein
MGIPQSGYGHSIRKCKRILFELIMVDRRDTGGEEILKQVRSKMKARKQAKNEYQVQLPLHVILMTMILKWNN